MADLAMDLNSETGTGSLKANKATELISSDKLKELKKELLSNYIPFITDCLSSLRGTEKAPMFERILECISKEHIILSLPQILALKNEILGLESKIVNFNKHVNIQIEREIQQNLISFNGNELNCDILKQPRDLIVGKKEPAVVKQFYRPIHVFGSPDLPRDLSNQTSSRFSKKQVHAPESSSSEPSNASVETIKKLVSKLPAKVEGIRGHKEGQKIINELQKLFGKQSVEKIKDFMIHVEVSDKARKKKALDESKKSSKSKKKADVIHAKVPHEVEKNKTSDVSKKSLKSMQKVVEPVTKPVVLKSKKKAPGIPVSAASAPVSVASKAIIEELVPNPVVTPALIDSQAPVPDVVINTKPAAKALHTDIANRAHEKWNAKLKLAITQEKRPIKRGRKKMIHQPSAKPMKKRRMTICGAPGNVLKKKVGTGELDRLHEDLREMYYIKDILNLKKRRTPKKSYIILSDDSDEESDSEAGKLEVSGKATAARVHLKETPLATQEIEPPSALPAAVVCTPKLYKRIKPMIPVTKQGAGSANTSSSSSSTG